MIEICEFKPYEIDAAIEGMDGLRNLIAPILETINYEGMGKQDVEQLARYLTLAKHALIAMGDYLQNQMRNPDCNGNTKGFAPGDTVWVVERDGEGNVCDMSGYMFLAEACGFVITFGFVDNLGTAEAILEFMADDTAINCETNVYVFPAGDVYLDKLDAEKIMLDALAGGSEAEP